MVCLEFEPMIAKWLAQTKPRSCGGCQRIVFLSDSWTRYFQKLQSNDCLINFLLTDFIAFLEHFAISILREDVCGRDEPQDLSHLHDLPESPSNEQRVEEGEHRGWNRQLDVRRCTEVHGPHPLLEHALVRLWTSSWCYKLFLEEI